MFSCFFCPFLLALALSLSLSPLVRFRAFSASLSPSASPQTATVSLDSSPSLSVSPSLSLSLLLRCSAIFTFDSLHDVILHSVEFTRAASIDATRASYYGTLETEWEGENKAAETLERKWKHKTARNIQCLSTLPSLPPLSLLRSHRQMNQSIAKEAHIKINHLMMRDSLEPHLLMYWGWYCILFTFAVTYTH